MNESHSQIKQATGKLQLHEEKLLWKVQKRKKTVITVTYAVSVGITTSEQHQKLVGYIMW